MTSRASGGRRRGEEPLGHAEIDVHQICATFAEIARRFAENTDRYAARYLLGARGLPQFAAWELSAGGLGRAWG